MKNVYIYCEGQTEEAFIQQLLYPYFIEFGIAVIPIICGTKRARSQKGGVSSYAKLTLPTTKVGGFLLQRPLPR